jgi:hypothetical protein
VCIPLRSLKGQQDVLGMSVQVTGGDSLSFALPYEIKVTSNLSFHMPEILQPGRLGLSNHPLVLDSCTPVEPRSILGISSEILSMTLKTCQGMTWTTPSFSGEWASTEVRNGDVSVANPLNVHSHCDSDAQPMQSLPGLVHRRLKRTPNALAWDYCRPW